MLFIEDLHVPVKAILSCSARILEIGHTQEVSRGVSLQAGFSEPVVFVTHPRDSLLDFSTPRSFLSFGPFPALSYCSAFHSNGINGLNNVAIG
jgi:hypothetical protein